MKRLAAVGALVALVPLALVGLLLWALFAAQPPGSDLGPANPGCSSTTVDAAVHSDELSPEQRRNAQVILRQGVVAKMPVRGLVVALVAASQESRIRNLKYGDRDSQGLFQMRPSQGWGTVAQITDPVYASRKFFRVLRAVPGWDLMSVPEAAQAVERSGYPGAYAQWEPRAWRVARAYLSAASGGVREPRGGSGGTSGPERGVQVAGGDPAVQVDGKALSAIAARQLRLAERIGQIDLRVVQGGYGGDGVAASKTSHNYPGVADVVPGTVQVEQLLRQVGFAAWARNIPGRSSAGSGAHVHAVSLLDPGDRVSPQVFGSWANHGNGLAGADNDPGPRPAWLPNLVARVGGTSLVPDTQQLAPAC
jgi:hypothetical protein